MNLSDLLTLFFATQAFHIAIQNTQTVGPSWTAISGDPLNVGMAVQFQQFSHAPLPSFHPTADSFHLHRNTGVFLPKLLRRGKGGVGCGSAGLNHTILRCRSAGLNHTILRCGSAGLNHTILRCGSAGLNHTILRCGSAGLNHTILNHHVNVPSFYTYWVLLSPHTKQPRLSLQNMRSRATIFVHQSCSFLGLREIPVHSRSIFLHLTTNPLQPKHCE